MTKTGQTRLKVIDVQDHPHGGRILRLRLLDGEAPGVRGLKGANLVAESPREETVSFRVLGFPLTGGKMSDKRIRDTGRVDLHVEEDDKTSDIGLGWVVSGL